MPATRSEGSDDSRGCEPPENPENVSLKTEVATGGGTALFGEGVRKVTGFILHLLLGRVLGPAAYGLYALGDSLTSISESVADLGLDNGMVRYASHHRGQGEDEQVRETVVTAVMLSAATSMILALGLHLLAEPLARVVFHDPGLGPVIEAFALAIPFLVVLGVLASFLQAMRRIDLDRGLSRVLRPLLLLGLVGAALVMGYGLLGAVWAFVLAAGLSVLAGFGLVGWTFPSVLRGRFSFEATGKLLSYSIPTLMVGISYIILTHTDRLMLGFFRASGQVGIYNAAAILSLQLSVFLGASISIFAPIVSELEGRDEFGAISDLYKVTSRWVLTLTLPFVLIVVLFPETLLGLFGPGFELAAHALVLLGLAQLINVATGPVGIVLQMTGRERLEALNGVVLVATNVGLNVLLIPFFGIVGAAAATGISMALFHLVRLHQVYQGLNLIPYGRSYGKPILAAVGAGVAGSLVSGLRVPGPMTEILVGVVLIVVTYVLVLALFGFEEDDHQVWNALRRQMTSGF